MDTKDYSTEHRKGQHLFSEERHEIEVRLKDGWSIYRIAKHLGRPYNTIKNEVARGSVKLYRGKVVRYKADVGEKTYTENRSRSRRQYKRLEVSPFLQYVETQFALVERKTRHAIWIKAVDHTASAVQEAVRRVMNYFGSKVSDVFKTVTADNGSEFAQLTELAKQGTQVYFTHPYSSWEKGTNECHNKLLRRFIPKGVRMDRYSEEDIAYMADWANSLPRKILGYRTPELLFEQELDCIYTVEILSTQIVA